MKLKSRLCFFSMFFWCFLLELFFHFKVSSAQQKLYVVSVSGIGDNSDLTAPEDGGYQYILSLLKQHIEDDLLMEKNIELAKAPFVRCPDFGQKNC